MKANPILKLQKSTFDNSEECDVLKQILWERGIRSEEAVKRFLSPQFADLEDPMQLKGMEKAVRLVDDAIQKEKSVCIYGDYDVDGMVSTSLLTRFFRDQGIIIRHYIPSRHEEGYGLNSKAIEELAESGVEFLLTVDCGITSIEEVALAKSLGMDVLITDHHQCPEVLPQADVIVNPHQPGCAYPNKNLCGAGVAFKWMEAYTSFKGIAMDYDRYLPFAALATVADVVKLTEENRVLVKLGLPMMERSELPGFQALLQECGIQPGELNAGHLGFQIAPRLNAVGRLENAELAIRLLVTDDKQEATEAAATLSGLNEERKRLEKEILEEAVYQVESKGKLPLFLIVSGQGWNEGVIGIVASRLVERYYRPTIVLALGEEGVAKGSARSISGLNIFEALKAHQNYLLKYGGHAQAAGLSLEAAKIEAFDAVMNHYAEERLGRLDLRPEITLDYEADLENVDRNLVEVLDKLAPFGFGNPRPVAYFSGVEIRSLRVIGKGHEHLAGAVCQGAQLPVNFVGFHQAELAKDLQTGERVDVAATIGINRFQGRETIQLQTKAIRSLDRQLINTLDESLEALPKHIFQFPIPLKYDKIMRLSTKPYLRIEGEDQSHLVIIDSLQDWIKMKNEVRLMGRERQKSHRFLIHEANDAKKGWTYLYAPDRRSGELPWDQIYRLDSTKFDLDWLPDVETLRAVYRWYLELIPKNGVGSDAFYRNLFTSSEFQLETGLIALWLFLDLGFIHRKGSAFARAPITKKVDLKEHPLMQQIRLLKETNL